MRTMKNEMLAARATRDRLKCEITALRRHAQGEYSRGYCEGTAKLLAQVYRGCPDDATILWIQTLIGGQYGKRVLPPEVEAHVEEYCATLTLPPRRGPRWFPSASMMATRLNKQETK